MCKIYVEAPSGVKSLKARKAGDKSSVTTGKDNKGFYVDIDEIGTHSIEIQFDDLSWSDDKSISIKECNKLCDENCLVCYTGEFGRVGNYYDPVFHTVVIFTNTPNNSIELDVREFDKVECLRHGVLFADKEGAIDGILTLNLKQGDDLFFYSATHSEKYIEDMLKDQNMCRLDRK